MMSTTKDQVRSIEEALDKALEALTATMSTHGFQKYIDQAKDDAITAIKQARSAPVQELTLDSYDEHYNTTPHAAQPSPVQEPVAWMHVMDNTEGLKANGKGIVSITQKRKHPFGKPGVDFSKSDPVTSTPLYTTPPNVATPLAAPAPEERKRQWVEVEQVKWDGEKFIAKLKEKNSD